MGTVVYQCMVVQWPSVFALCVTCCGVREQARGVDGMMRRGRGGGLEGCWQHGGITNFVTGQITRSLHMVPHFLDLRSWLSLIRWTTGHVTGISMIF